MSREILLNIFYLPQNLSLFSFFFNLNCSPVVFVFVLRVYLPKVLVIGGFCLSKVRNLVKYKQKSSEKKTVAALFL